MIIREFWFSPMLTRWERLLSELYPAESVVDIKTPFNRFDTLSVVGIAREVAANAGIKPKIIEPKLAEVGNGPKVAIEVEPKIASRFMLAAVTVKPSTRVFTYKSWLEATGVRSLMPVVDITNFVMLEWGQPLHAYDAAKVKGNLRVRWAKKGEKLVTLNFGRSRPNTYYSRPSYR